VTSDFSRAAIFRAQHDAAVALVPEASAALLFRELDDDAIVKTWARDLERAARLWVAPSHRRTALSIPIGAVHFLLAGAEVPPFVPAVAMANGWERFRVDDDGGVEFENSLWSTVGGFDLDLVTGTLIEAAERADERDEELADKAALEECARLKICELAIRGIERAAPAFVALPRVGPITFFCAAHDDDKALLCAL
jgi:hypothetical protein